MESSLLSLFPVCTPSVVWRRCHFPRIHASPQCGLGSAVSQTQRGSGAPCLAGPVSAFSSAWGSRWWAAVRSSLKRRARGPQATPLLTTSCKPRRSCDLFSAVTHRTQESAVSTIIISLSRTRVRTSQGKRSAGEVWVAPVPSPVELGASPSWHVDVVSSRVFTGSLHRRD